jgi:hypothetical protein
MSAAIPQQLVPAGTQLGVDSFSQIKPQRIILKPQVQTTFRPNGVNKVSFKIPAFANGFLDTSKSFLSFVVGYDTVTDVTAVTTTCRLNNGAPVFQRLTLKSNAGLVIDQIDNYHVLSQIISATMPVSRAVSVLEGRDQESVFVDGSMKAEACVAQKMTTQGVPIRHYINAGLLSKHTKKWLPLGAMDAGGHAFELEMQLSDNAFVLRQTGAVADPVYRLEDVVYNMEVRTLDESLCKRFNQIACAPGAEMRIGFKTMHAHTAVLNSNKNVIKIHESATSLDRVWNAFLVSGDLTKLVDTSAYKLVGGTESASNRVISRYNARIGSNWLYNQFVEEDKKAIGNMQTCSHVKNALGYQDHPLVMEYRNASTHLPTDRHYVNVFDFQYSGSEGFANGISSSTPLEMYFDLPAAYTANDIMVFSFAEISYDLVVKNGMVHYEEVKPGSNTVYS